MNTKIRVAALAVAAALSGSVHADLPTYGVNSAAVAGLLGDPLSEIHTSSSLSGVPVQSTFNLNNYLVSRGFEANMDGYSASGYARTALGSNHASVGGSNPGGSAVFAAAGSQWYDQTVITGGTGTGAVSFTMHVSGNVVVGNSNGSGYFGLYASSVHPTQWQGNWVLGDDTNVQTLASYSVSTGSTESGQIDVTLNGTQAFTYDQPFYLLGYMGLSVAGHDSFFNNRTGNTILDFSHSAYITGLELPEGATASFTSGTDYNNIPVMSVPEPGTYAMMLAGLGLVGCAAKRRRSNAPQP